MDIDDKLFSDQFTEPVLYLLRSDVDRHIREAFSNHDLKSALQLAQVILERVIYLEDFHVYDERRFVFFTKLTCYPRFNHISFHIIQTFHERGDPLLPYFVRAITYTNENLKTSVQHLTKKR